MRFIQALIAKATATPAPEELHVHFHRGPQGQPVPCFADDCSMPSLRV
jgi:hypothetical protein